VTIVAVFGLVFEMWALGQTDDRQTTPLRKVSYLLLRAEHTTSCHTNTLSRYCRKYGAAA